MKAQFLLGFILSTVSLVATAEPTYQCSLNGLERTIEVSSPADAPVPCSVDYTKESGEKKSLWRASNDGEYCKTKAADFAEKLRGWGWVCNAVKS